MAGLRKLRSKYYIRVWIDGKEKLLPTGTTNRREAETSLRRVQREEIEIKQRIRKEIEELKNRLLISDGCKYFLKRVGVERGLRESTLGIHRLSVKDFQKCFKGIVYFNNFKQTHYSDLVDYLQKRYNPTSVNIKLRSIRAMNNFLYEKRLIKNIPFNIKQIRTDEALPKFILPDEMDRIYKQIKDLKLLSTFKTYEVTGIRLGELHQSHRNGGYISIEKSKSRKERIIPIPLENIPDYDLARKDPYSTSWITHQFTKACKAAGLKGKSLHSLRHTFALRKLLETNNISLVKELLGHSSVSVTEVYTKFPRGFIAQVFQDRNINRTKQHYLRLEA